MSASSLAWVVVGAVFGSVFVVACVVSVVKAVRDRRQLKARNKARRAAHSNGQVPEANRRLRPNLVLVHDREKEDRVRRGSPSTATTPGSLRSPGDPGPIHPHVTTVAQVAGRSVSRISGKAVGDDDVRAAADSHVIFGGSRLLGRRRSEEIFVDFRTEAIAFRRMSTPVYSAGCGGSSAVNGGGGGGGEGGFGGGGGGGLISAFPVPRWSAVDSAPFSDCCGNGGAFRVRARRCTDGGILSPKPGPLSPVVPDKASGCTFRVRSPFPGFSRTLDPESSLSCTTAEGESALVGARRNSYSADVSGRVRVDTPAPRRHSDDCRYPALSGSLSRPGHGAVRGSRCLRGDGAGAGADNPAYEAMGDEGAL